MLVSKKRLDKTIKNFDDRLWEYEKKINGDGWSISRKGLSGDMVELRGEFAKQERQLKRVQIDLNVLLEHLGIKIAEMTQVDKVYKVEEVETDG